MDVADASDTTRTSTTLSPSHHHIVSVSSGTDDVDYEQEEQARRNRRRLHRHRVDVTERDDSNDDDDEGEEEDKELLTQSDNNNNNNKNSNMENLDITAVDEETSITSNTTAGRVDGRRGCGRGIIEDFRSTVLTWWCSEMTNFNEKTVAVTFFLFFACIAPAITFGAIYGKATENRIGAVEMMIATAWVGIVYSLIGGQPMMINGGTCVRV